jgi:hypothetical protein
MSRVLTFALVALFCPMLGVWLVGCTSVAPGSSASTCVPGQTVSCACPGNVTGVQTCAPGGKTFEACACGSSSDSGSSSSGSIAASGSGTGSLGGSGSQGASGSSASTGSAASSVYQCFASGGLVGLSPGVDAGALGTCGASDFTVACGMGTCPLDSTCSGGTSCECNPGFQAEDCSGNPCTAACSYPNYRCAPQHTCSFSVQYDSTQTTAEMLYAYGSGGTFVALRIQPALALQGTYQPVAWGGASPFVTPANASPNGPFTGDLVMPIDSNNGAVGPGNIAIWVMVVHGSTVTNYVSRPGGAPVQISGGSINFMPGPATQGFSVSFEEADDAGVANGPDAGLGGIGLEAVMPDGGPDPTQPVFIVANTTVRVVGANSATAQCQAGGGGATCTSFSTCSPNGGLNGDGCRSDSCPYSMCGANDPSTGQPVCCTTLSGSCSDSSECCDGNLCTDGICQQSTRPSLCGQDAGAAVGDAGAGGTQHACGLGKSDGVGAVNGTNDLCACGPSGELNNFNGGCLLFANDYPTSTAPASSCTGYACCFTLNNGGNSCCECLSAATLNTIGTANRTCPEVVANTPGASMVAGCN